MSQTIFIILCNGLHQKLLPSWSWRCFYNMWKSHNQSISSSVFQTRSHVFSPAIQNWVPVLPPIISCLKSRCSHSTPNNREGVKIDAVDCTFCSTEPLIIKGISYIAYMNIYSYTLWDQLLEVLNTLPDNKRSKSCLLQREGMLLGKQLLNSVKHSLHHNMWLLSTRYKGDYRTPAIWGRRPLQHHYGLGSPGHG